MFGVVLAFHAHDAASKIADWPSFSIYLLLALLSLVVASVTLRWCTEWDRDAKKRWLQLPAIVLLILQLAVLQRVVVPALAG
jgi:hypothetical protein